MEKTEKLLSVLKEERWEEVYSLWLEMLEEGTNIEPLQKAIKILWNRGQRKLAMEILEVTATTGREKHPRLWLESLRLLAEYNPVHKGIIPSFAEAFGKVYEDRPYITAWIGHIMRRNLPTTQFIKTLDRLVIFKEGMPVEHRSGWGIGTIKKIYQDKMEILVDLEKKPQHHMDALAATECLTPLEADSFEVLLRFDLQKLKKEADQEPVKLVCRVLKFTSEPTNTHEIKQNLCPQIVEEKAWSLWWSKTRKKLLVDPYIEVSSGTHARYSLREQPTPWEDEARLNFDKTEILEKPSFILDYLKNSTDKKHLADFVNILNKICSQHCAENRQWYALECYLAIQACIEQKAAVPDNLVDLSTILGQDAMFVFSHLRLPSLAQRTWKTIAEYETDWEKDIPLVFKQGTDLSRDTLYRVLIRNSKYEQSMPIVFQEIVNNRLSFSDAYIWITKHIIQERIPENEIFDIVDTFTEMVETGGTFRAIGQSEHAKKLSKLFTDTLASKISKKLDKDNERAHRIFDVLLQNTWLPSTFWIHLKTEIQERFPKLFAKVKPIYTTKTALDKYERELQDILQNKLPANSRAIGHALSFGDLSENAELDAAREIERELTQKAQEMRNNISRATVIDFASVSTEKVEIGTHVTLKNEKGEEVNYTILGPWDVDMQKGIISFMSPVAHKLIGVSCNQNVSIPAGDYVVVNITKYNEEEAEN